MSDENNSESLESRVGKIEKLLEGGDRLWSFSEIQGILNKTDLSTDMEDMKLGGIDKRVDNNEGCISILHQSHLAHTNTDLTEFKNMHGFTPESQDDEELQESRDESTEKGIAIIFYGILMMFTGSAIRFLETVVAGVFWGVFVAMFLLGAFFFVKEVS